MFIPATHSYVLLLRVNGGAELARNIASSGVGTMGAQERGFKRIVLLFFCMYCISSIRCCGSLLVLCSCCTFISLESQETSTMAG